MPVSVLLYHVPADVFRRANWLVNDAGRPCRVRLLWHVRQRLVSVKPHGLVSEYYSIAYLYSALPFNGRIPVFIGDDKQAV